MSFTDSFLDFDAIKDWFEDNTNADMAGREKVNDGVNEADFCCKTVVQQHLSNESDSIDIGSKPIFDQSGPMDCGSHSVAKVIGGECEILENASCPIEDEIKVSLVCGSGNSVGMYERGTKCEATDGNGVKCETVIDEGGSDSSESEHASTSSSSSSSSSNSSSSDDDVEVDEEEDEDKVEEMKLDIEKEFNETGEVEEGEIRDANQQDMASKTDDEDDDVNDNDAEAMVGWSDIDDADNEEDGGGAMKGPITSKNELKDLPPVPPVDATLLPHHQMLPVGVVLSIIGTQVIVEGIEKHNPLNDGSILWITESKSPLGLVDEIFGPVKHPYYIVRYNSESEVPAGIHTGTLISFVPEFASHVLNNKDIYKKGYDASGANDEEVSDEAEFSDDEKEAEYKRMQKMTKRGTNDQKPRSMNNKMNVRNQDEPWKKGKQSPLETPTNVGPVPPNQHHGHFSALPAMVDHGNVSNSFGVGQGLVSGAGIPPPIPPITQMACYNAPSNGGWGNGMPFQQPQGALLPNGFPVNGMPWLSLNSQQYPFQMPFPNTMPFQQQVGPSQRLLSAAVFPGGQSNAIPGSTDPQGLVGPNAFNPVAFGIGLQRQPSQPTLNVGEQGIIPNGLPMGQNSNVSQPGGIPSNNEASQQVNLGVSTHGRGPYRRGGGRFASGRGRKQSG